MYKTQHPTEDTREEVVALLQQLKRQLPSLEKQLRAEQVYSEDGFYRFYHGSPKVFGLQDNIRILVKALKAIAPERVLNTTFSSIVTDALAVTPDSLEQANWRNKVQPILVAYSHAKYFLEMAVKYESTLEQPPLTMPMGWAALLYLFELR